MITIMKGSVRRSRLPVTPPPVPQIARNGPLIDGISAKILPVREKRSVLWDSLLACERKRSVLWEPILWDSLLGVQNGIEGVDE
mmetsp:Transcript_33322/g.80696  ORF Transcript_33322/g.80696 Transcript_33322/m.80696 type:complete len:84 (+) Transcript_33322:25-276(+)